MIRWARVSLKQEGFHAYVNAPKDVDFLRALHRHLFHITLWIEQFHSDRDLEYFQVLKWFKPQVEEAFRLSESCERYAAILLRAATANYPQRRMMCEVLEDGENGALVELEPQEVTRG